jgi:hypothetical protein
MQIHLRPKHFSGALAGMLTACLMGTIILSSCRKDDSFNTSPDFKLAFSSDTIVFDTVFTTLGSVTRQLHVYNRGDNPVKISSIKLARGESSPFRLNVDGQASLEVNDIELQANDSLFIFIKVTINPNNTANPMVENDSILFSINGQQQDVDLVAWGQDAHFYNNKVLSSDFIITNDKPHVIYGSLTVDTLFTLTIQEGARIFFHKDAELIVCRDATLKVNGTIENPIVFRGDRLEMEYDSLPGQWGRIWLAPGSKNNEINYAEIRNGYIGIQVDNSESSSLPALRLSNTIIKNMTYYGLLAQTAWVQAANCVFDGCGGNEIALSVGGNYDFRHCTVANFWNYSARRSASILINNYYRDTLNVVHAQDLIKAYFGNCILYGNSDEEIDLDNHESAQFNVTFDHCLLRTELASDAPAAFIDCLRNKEPLFKNIIKHDLELDTLSPAKDIGSLTIINESFLPVTSDIINNSRTSDTAPDLGAYERIEGKKD